MYIEASMCPATTTQSIGRGGYSKMHIVSQVSALNMYEAFLVIHEARETVFSRLVTLSTRVSIVGKSTFQL